MGRRGSMEASLAACVQENLSLFLYDNARFLGERLVALNPSEVRVPPAAQLALQRWDLAGRAAVPCGLCAQLCVE